MIEVYVCLWDKVWLKYIVGLLESYVGQPEICILWQGLGLSLQAINKVYNGPGDDPYCMYKIKHQMLTAVLGSAW